MGSRRVPGAMLRRMTVKPILAGAVARDPRIGLSACRRRGRCFWCASPSRMWRHALAALRLARAAAAMRGPKPGPNRRSQRAAFARVHFRAGSSKDASVFQGHPSFSRPRICLQDPSVCALRFASLPSECKQVDVDWSGKGMIGRKLSASTRTTSEAYPTTRGQQLV